MLFKNIADQAEDLTLDHDEIHRYGRHLTLPQLGVLGQKRLKASRVLLIGAGGLGSPLGLYLAAAGVGTLGLVDSDTVEASNLQRQVLYGHSDVGRPKIEAAVDRLREINPLISLVPHATRLDAANALDLIADYDIVVDGSDNFPTRYLVNDACVLAGKPDVWGAISRFEGQVAIFWGRHGACYRCLFPEPPPPGLVPSCADGGVLGVLPGIVGALQAIEVVKLVADLGEPLIGRLVLFDALRMRFRELRLKKSLDCPICGPNPTIRRLTAYEDAPDGACSAPETITETPNDDQENSTTNPEALPFEISVEQLKTWLDEERDLHLVDVREQNEHMICNIEGARLLPMSELVDRLDEIERDMLTIIHCHHGPRSSQVVMYLRQQGYERVTSLAGGIDTWSLAIDPNVPRY